MFIVVSGDVAYSGQADQYVLAKSFLKTIQAEIQKETASPVSFVVVPGNHDCDFSGNTAARKMLIKSIELSEHPEIDTSIINPCTSIQSSFFEFRKSLEDDSEVDDDLLWRSKRFEVNGKSLGFECLNISWNSCIQETPGSLFFPVSRYQAKTTEEMDVRFVVMHHPLNWFNQNIYRTFRKFIRQLADVVISGHEHQGNVGIIEDTESDKSAFIEGCVLYEEKSPLNSSFNVVSIDIGNSKFKSIRHKWNGTRYEASEEGTWSEYHTLPANHCNPYPISNSFQEMIDDPGAFIKHPGGQHKTNITLSDIYIFPDLRKMGGSEGKKRNFISSSKLLSPDFTTEGVLIEGEEKAGCTSLLYQLYRYYHDRGYVPVLIKGKDLRRANEDDLDDLILKTFATQYDKKQIPDFQLVPSSQKLLLLDDFDDGPLKAADARACLLCAIRKRFGHFVVSVNSMFEMREMLDGDASRSLISLEHYKLQPFGHVLRSQLIQRWFSIGSDGTHDEASFISKCDQAERLMKTVMTKTVIPKIPLYMLTLLQSLEAGRSGDFKESALGYYYQYLLTDAFQHAGVKPDKLTELFQYSVHLAWEFHVLGNSELSEFDLRNFNARFSEKWHTVDFSARLELLIHARVLYCVGEDYAFRYPYIYYYLKGQYISDNMDKDEIRAYVGKCCNHLYVRDYANTVLFLAHHTNDDYLLNSISASLNSIFQSCSPITFKGDTSNVQKLIDDSPKLTYTGEHPIEHRKRRDARLDELDDEKDGLADSEEESDNLSLIAQLTMLFKNTEILGQILKNQYSKIPRIRKGELLNELFNGPLRALRDFYNFIEKNPDALVAEIEAELFRKRKTDKEEDRKRIAKKVVAGIVQIVSFAFILKASQGANSDSLIEDVRDIVSKNDTLAFKLIELCIHLDSPKAIPRTMLKHIYNESKNDMIAARLIQLMVLNRLYMFKTAEQDMQWLSAELNLDIGMQHSITYQDKKRKLIK